MSLSRYMEHVTAGGSSVARTTTLNLETERLRSGPASEKESAARVALEARAGRTLGDREWAQARTRLVEFVSILRDWHRKEISASGLPKAA